LRFSIALDRASSGEHVRVTVCVAAAIFGRHRLVDRSGAGKVGRLLSAALKTAEERLRFYAAQFNTVEVDATFYGVGLGAQRRAVGRTHTPGFIFNIKAFAMLTQHPRRGAASGRMKSMLPADERARRACAIRRVKFWKWPLDVLSALGPLRTAGKLGHLLFQFRRTSPHVPQPRLYRRAQGADAGCGDRDRVRHNSWFDGAQRAETIRFSIARLTFVSIDTPPGTVESIFAVTGAEAYVRFHGRNREKLVQADGAPRALQVPLAEAELAQWPSG